MSFPKYPEYKESGIDWAGTIPEHWHAAKLRWLAKLNSGNGITSSDIEEGGTYPVYGGNGIRGYTEDYTHQGLHVLIGRQGALCGNINYGDGRFWASEHAVVVEPTRDLDAVWLGELLRSMNLNQYSVAAAQPGLAVDRVSALAIPVPPKAEQTKIANFLQHETAKIDALIHEQERLIELLQEKRQAVISHVVTKGLDPDVPMKDSRVEWLGEVPSHWRVGKLRWYATIQGGLAKGKDYDGKSTVTLPYLRVANVQEGYVDLSEVKEIAVLQSEVDRYSLKKGDVLMNEGGDNDKLGRGTVWNAALDPCLHQNHVFAIRPNGYVRPEWLAMFTQSNRARYYFYLNSKQSTNLASISSSNVMNLDLPMPTVQEQQSILQALGTQLTQFAELQRHANVAINLLAERRSALISAAVTGKIDVRNWQPPADEGAYDDRVREAGLEATA